MKREGESEVDPFGVPFVEPMVMCKWFGNDADSTEDPAFMTVGIVPIRPSARDVEFDKLRGGDGWSEWFFEDDPPPGQVWSNVLRDLRESNRNLSSTSSCRRMAARMGVDRDRAGRRNYGKPLEVNDGRTMRDAVEEGADQVAYLRRELDQLLDREVVPPGTTARLDPRTVGCRNLYLRALGLWLDLMQHWADHYQDGAAFRAETANVVRVAATLPEDR